MTSKKEEEMPEDPSVSFTSSSTPEYVLNLTEKQRIVRYFILNSPPGQLWNVIEDCELLLGSDDSEISAELLQQMVAEYNENELSTVDIFSSKVKKGLICHAGRVSFDEYFLPKTKEIFTVDHLLLRTVGEVRSSPIELINKRTSPFRDALEARIEKYIKSTYENRVRYCSLNTSTNHNASWGVYESLETESFTTEKKEGKGEIEKENEEEKKKEKVENKNNNKENKHHRITLVISARNVNLNNFRAASWISEWNVNFDETDPSATLYGLIRVRAHYFEDGNVQTNHKKKFEFEMKNCMAKPEEFANEVSQFIEEKEAEMHSAINLLHVKFSDESLKAIRRTLPLTRQKFDWYSLTLSIKNDINQHSKFNLSK